MKRDGSNDDAANGVNYREMMVVLRQGRSRILSILLFGSMVAYISLTIFLQTHFESTFHHDDAARKDSMNRLIQPITDQKVIHKLNGLSCLRFIGGSDYNASEMIYWEDIPNDSLYLSPFSNPNRVLYMTFEVDNSGFNNVRMGLETVVALAIATGRTLVLPAAEELRHLRAHSGHDGAEQQTAFSFQDFFHMDSIAKEHTGFKMITMEDFLQREGMTGNLKDANGSVVYPPHRRTNWDGAGHDTLQFELEHYLRTVGTISEWDPEVCLVVFPTSGDSRNVQRLETIATSLMNDADAGSHETYIGHPVRVDASAKDRLQEGWANRERLCFYDEGLQDVPLLHFTGGPNSDFPTRSDRIKEFFGFKIPRPNDKSMDRGKRILVHFYAFLFFEDWKQDLWMKRFIRDHMRYSDSIQCAAASVVSAIRDLARSASNPHGDFDTFHIRRGDFASDVKYDAWRILNMSQPEIKMGSTVYIATDETNRAFFEPLAMQYKLLFLDDFEHLLDGFNTNMYGMVDQLIAARGRVFFGCWGSTFSGYILRLRGYFANKAKAPGYEHGVVASSYYYAKHEHKYHMQEYWPVKKQFYAREFPTSWRLIDHGL